MRNIIFILQENESKSRNTIVFSDICPLVWKKYFSDTFKNFGQFLNFPHLIYLFSLDPAKRNLRLNIEKDEPIKTQYVFLRPIIRACNYFVISTDESFLFYWLIVLNIFVLYNLWFSIARQAFHPLQTDYSKIWDVMDYTSDAMYFLDIFIQFRTGYLEQGMSK